ncbi:radical SAM protein [Dehalococcoides mccartyi]|jgi:pyruvate formate lyase activating enzyme|uniref:Radical SAM, Pyruvate-formate lyase-activating enzyme like protein n=1 Tax=Dehalococcoides mccartyi TaxID=61435 RepID=A0A328EKI7_9CHLR|nr:MULTISPECIES: AmmeMemoRadiSam system radical SAM enzyme [Dehalococcoides]AGG06771.1 radical SAM domain-containing protein [Dehalococcoides mccartyi DCMB5]AGG08266.1 radical SAM domain-containing protein [Dehalococcoides mccartyi BTF08]KSV17695.1 radical SAM protein [Dehalococcoides mccartyi]OBW61297.1 MAG: AmmeMemoRadiSam system radical SAM enzyme [Dehalococcoides mccartyi]RAL69180.1 Radical SAM, Pyruvate-formate lyase-activating enzyme like protein [Dehalococcoides mccartyi]
MHEALLYQKMPNGVIRCHTCQWNCRINPNHLGVCQVYQNINGSLFSLNYGRTSSVAVDPIEKKPLYHFYPGSQVFSLGSWGCNFHCTGCQNWEIACPDTYERLFSSRTLLPEQAVSMAREHHCQGIAFTYNEPTVWFEYTLDCARLAKNNGLYTVYVTNGYMTADALDTIGPYMDAFRVDIKGFKADTYKKLSKIQHWEKILATTERAKSQWGMHVEVVTNIIPTYNDDPEQLTGIARWIKTRLGELTPWHVTRFYPCRDMLDVPPTPVETLEKAVEIGQGEGLKYVYMGNVPGHKSETTCCPKCGQVLIRRHGYDTEICGLDNDHCRHCRSKLYIRLSSPTEGE